MSVLDTFEASDLPLDAIALALQGDPDEVRVLVKDTAGQPRYYGMLAGATRISETALPLCGARIQPGVLQQKCCCLLCHCC